jgi:2-oxoglutarate dehydrogenase E1 component
MSAVIDLFKATSPLYGGNAAFLEDLYERYLHDPESIPPQWRQRFDAWRQAANDQPDISHAPIRDNFRRLAKEKRPGSKTTRQILSPAGAEKQAAVLRLINAHRIRGHQSADLDPLNLRDQKPAPDLLPAYHNLIEADMETVFNTGSLYGPDRMTLREIITFVTETYRGHFGAEYMHITDTREKRWIQKHIESCQARPEIDDEGKRWLLTLLTAAEGIEKFLHTKYVGQKRFSLEGAESLIPLLDELIQRGGSRGIEEFDPRRHRPYRPGIQSFPSGDHRSGNRGLGPCPPASPR